MKSVLLGAAAVSLLVMGCGAGVKQTLPSEAIDGRYGGAAASFRNDGGRVIILARAKEHQGLTAVCAAYFTKDGVGPAQFVDEAAKGSKVIIGGDTILVGVRFANRLPDNSEPEGQRATCVSTSAPWKASYEGQQTVVRIVPRKFRS